MALKTIVNFLKSGGATIEPFSRVLSAGAKKRTPKKTRKKSIKTKTKRKKNLSRKRNTKRKNMTYKNKKRTKMTINKKQKKTKKRTTKKRQCNCDAKRFYKGVEPSPKGLGFCAHCIPLNTVMKGLDGNLWKNEKYTKGKRWVNYRHV